MGEAVLAEEVQAEHRSWLHRMAMVAVFVANGLAFGAWAGNIPRLREAAGLDDASLGLLLLCVSLGAVAAMQVAGRYGAVVGTARGSWISGLLLAAALPLPALMPGYAALLGAGAAIGFGLGLLDVCMNAHAAWLERRWGAPIMSSFHAGWSFGQLAGAALAGSSCATSASASAEDHAFAALSVSSEAVGNGIAKRDGGGWARRKAVAPGRPRKGCGRSPHPARTSNTASASARFTSGHSRRARTVRSAG